jgi:hypothetical protein
MTTLTQPENTYWHFLKEDRKLSHNDGRLVRVGETLRVDVKPKYYGRGLHASLCLLNTLEYAPGPILCLVTLGGEIDRAEYDDLVAAQERTVLWLYDASRLLREFACDVAELSLLAEQAAGKEPDPRLFTAISVMRQFLRGDTTEDERIAAYRASYRVARSDAESAVRRAGDNEAWSAAYRAARSAARSAADSAAVSSAYRAAESAAYRAFNDQITQTALSARADGLGEFADGAGN